MPQDGTRREAPDILAGAANNDLDEVLAALAVNPEDILRVDRETRGTPLHLAAYRGNVEAFALLLDQPGASLWAEDGQGRSVLLVAVTAGHEGLAKLALARSSAELGLGGGANVVSLRSADPEAEE